MDKRTITLTSIIFGLIVVGMFTFAYVRTQEVKTIPPVTNESQELVVAAPLGIDRIDAKQFYGNGVHTFVGEILMPTPCDLLEVTSVVQESYPEQVRLDFTVVNNSENCIQVITPQRFSVTAAASPEATMSATLLGVPVILNLIPAQPGESPEDFEVFIKG